MRGDLSMGEREPLPRRGGGGGGEWLLYETGAGDLDLEAIL